MAPADSFDVLLKINSEISVKNLKIYHYKPLTRFFSLFNEQTTRIETKNNNIMKQVNDHIMVSLALQLAKKVYSFYRTVMSHV